MSLTCSLCFGSGHTRRTCGKWEFLDEFRQSISHSDNPSVAPHLLLTPLPSTQLTSPPPLRRQVTPDFTSDDTSSPDVVINIDCALNLSPLFDSTISEPN